MIGLRKALRLIADEAVPCAECWETTETGQQHQRRLMQGEDGVGRTFDYFTNNSSKDNHSYQPMTPSDFAMRVIAGKFND